MFHHARELHREVGGEKKFNLLIAAGVAADDQRNGLFGTGMVPKNLTTRMPRVSFFYRLGESLKCEGAGGRRPFRRGLPRVGLRANQGT
jgi:hypothetical protein